MKELNEQRILDIKNSLKENPWVTDHHPIFNHSTIEPIFNTISGTKAIGGSIAYMDYTEPLGDFEEMQKAGLKLYIKFFDWVEMRYFSHGDRKIKDAEMTQAISRMGVNRMFELGEQHYKELVAADGNWWNGSLEVKPPTPPGQEKTPFMKNPWKWFLGLFKRKVEYIYTPEMNVERMQRKLLSKLLILANIPAWKGRRGPAQNVIVSGKLATALQDNTMFTYTSNTEAFASSIPGIHLIGSIAGLNIYVDPYMHWNDHRILVWRKGREAEPGLSLAYQIGSIKPGVTEDNMKSFDSANIKMIESGENLQTQYICAEIEWNDRLI